MRQVEGGRAEAGWRARSDLDVAVAQLRGVERLTRAWRAAQDAAAGVSPSREARMDVERELAVRRRMQDALIARTHEQLRSSGQFALGPAGRTAVLVHRSEWFTRTVAAGLAEGGCRVVGQLGNGADAVGVAAAEQPDLVLVEDRLEMLTGEQAVREVRRWCPEAVVVAQVANSAMVPPMLQAGAWRVFTRLTSPAEVTGSLLTLMAAGS